LGSQRRHHDSREPGETHDGKVYKQAWSTSNRDEKAVAQKKIKQSGLFVLLVLDIGKTHADNAECHHKALGRQYQFHAS
jgi:hypothetical protein